MEQPARYVTADDYFSIRPVHVVWELTLACDLKCQHCGSRAGKVRSQELSIEESLDLIRQLATLGTRQITLIGGEAYLRRDWLEIIRAIRDSGMDCSLQSGGLSLTKERVRQAADAGLQAAGISIDGLADLHDRLRGVKGSFAAAFRALRQLREHGIRGGVNTQITAPVIPQLRQLMKRLIRAGVRNWQVQLTVAMGRAADHPELILQPYQLLDLMPLLADLFHEGEARGLLLQPGNNIGYFGPYESLWRGSGDERVHWMGCSAARTGIGIEADGTIKGCPSLPTTPYAGGNIRDLSLKDLWQTNSQFDLTRNHSVEKLWGFCRTCYYADICYGGCTWTSHSLLGRAGNNPYCHHRVLELAQSGLRERVVQVEPAPGQPFDHGRFELITESLNGHAGPVKESSLKATPLVQIESSRKATSKSYFSNARTTPPPLLLCRGCNCYVKSDTLICPYCSGDVRTLATEYARKLTAARRTYHRLVKCLDARAQ